MDNVLNSHILYVYYKFAPERKRKENKDEETTEERQVATPFRLKNIKSIEYNPQNQVTFTVSWLKHEEKL